MEEIVNKEQKVLEAKRDYFNAGKKNQGGAAYNLINLGYENNKEG